MSKQLECRVVITDIRDEREYKILAKRLTEQFSLGMYDPISGKYAELGVHPTCDKDKIVGDLKKRIEQEGHRCTFSEVSGRPHRK